MRVIEVPAIWLLDQGSGHENVVVILKEALITGNWGCRDVSHATTPSRHISPSARILKFTVLGIAIYAAVPQFIEDTFPGEQPAL